MSLGAANTNLMFVLFFLCLVCEKVESKGRTTYNEVRWFIRFMLNVSI